MSRYQPWRRNDAYSLMFFFLAATCTGLAILRAISPVWAAMGAAGCLVTALVHHKKAARRKFGKTFEGAYVAMAMDALRRSPFKGIPNAKGGTHEDIDLLVIGKGAPVPVEIKSYIRWSTIFWRWFGARERRAVAQSKRQQSYAKAQSSIIWLPQGRRGFWQRFSQYPSAGNNVILVFGGVKELMSCLHQIQGTYGN